MATRMPTSAEDRAEQLRQPLREELVERVDVGRAGATSGRRWAACRRTRAAATAAARTAARAARRAGAGRSSPMRRVCARCASAVVDVDARAASTIERTSAERPSRRRCRDRWRGSPATGRAACAGGVDQDEAERRDDGGAPRTQLADEPARHGAAIGGALLAPATPSISIVACPPHAASLRSSCRAGSASRGSRCRCGSRRAAPRACRWRRSCRRRARGSDRRRAPSRCAGR